MSAFKLQLPILSSTLCSEYLTVPGPLWNLFLLFHVIPHGIYEAKTWTL